MNNKNLYKRVKMTKILKTLLVIGCLLNISANTDTTAIDALQSELKTVVEKQEELKVKINATTTDSERQPLIKENKALSQQKRSLRKQLKTMGVSTKKGFFKNNNGKRNDVSSAKSEEKDAMIAVPVDVVDIQST